MAVTKKPPINFSMTVPATGAYPTLFEARAFKDERGIEGKDKSFSLRLMFRPDHADLPGIRQKLFEAAAQEWPGAQFSDPQAPGYMQVDWPLKSGDALADKAAAKNPPRDHSHLRGWLILNTSTGEAYPPGLGVVRNGDAVDVPFQPIEARATFKADFYGGMDCYARLAFKAFQVGNNIPCVKAYLQAVQSLAPQGERNSKLEAGGGQSASAAFGQAVRGHVSAIDPRGPAGGMP